jgi:hypothetical protein
MRRITSSIARSACIVPARITEDQFFSEEQFEVCRALGFHMVSGFFDGSDEFSFLTSEPCAFANREAAFKEVINLLGHPDKNVSPE